MMKEIKNILKKYGWALKCLLGFGSVAGGIARPGSICWVAEHTGVDAHNYPKKKGGDGEHPFHFVQYHCHQCGKEFYV